MPLRGLSTAKSRLGALGGSARRDLAAAMALDTVTAVLAARCTIGVHVVCDDETLSAALLRLRPDVWVHRGAPQGLNPALEFGERQVGRSHGPVHIAAVLGDLPCMDGDAFAAVLCEAAKHRRAVVGDLEGSGTTVLAVRPGERLLPQFGLGSLRRHLEQGAVELSAPDEVRRDVDTPSDLEDAGRIGLQTRTRALFGRGCLPVVVGRPVTSGVRTS